MYDIGIPEIVCTDKYEDTTHSFIKYDAESITRPEVCSNTKCRSPKPIKPHIHSKRTNQLRDVRSEGKLVIINLTVRHYRCPYCGNITADQFTFYNKNSHMTNRLREEFVRRCINGETFSYIANDYNVDHKTVAAAFRAYVKEHEDLLNNNYTPEVLGIDEAHIDDHYRLVLTDVKNERLLDMKKDNHKPTVKRYLRTMDQDICKCVTMDFAPGYASCVAEILPSASIVIDKFHVVQEINRCLDNVRKDIQNELRSQGVNIRRFKQSRLLFMTNWEDLSPEAEEKLSEWFMAFPDLYEAYMVKEVFRDIYLTCKEKSKASELFDGWLGIIPDWKRFQAMRKTFSSRKQHILNYWDYPWTNAYTESVNNQIKKIEKAGRGYKFDVLRERCLLEINKPKPDRVNPRTAVYEPVASPVMHVAESETKYNVNTRSAYTAASLDVGLVHLVGNREEMMRQYLAVQQDRLHSNAAARLAMYRQRLIDLQKERARD